MKIIRTKVYEYSNIKRKPTHETKFKFKNPYGLNRSYFKENVLDSTNSCYGEIKIQTF